MKRLLFGAAVFILGVIVGASVTGVIIGRQIDHLYVKNLSLEDQLASTEKELKQLRNNNDNHKRLVSKINTLVNFSDDNGLSEYEKGSIELIVEKKINDWLKVIIGQEIEKINYVLVPTIIDNRELEVDGISIRLKVNLVVISEHVFVHVEVITLKKHYDKAVVGGAQ